jgi:hypothetical protein
MPAMFMGPVFTREYTQYTAGSTFCFVVLVLLGNQPLVSLSVNGVPARSETC